MYIMTSVSDVKMPPPTAMSVAMMMTADPAIRAYAFLYDSGSLLSNVSSLSLLRLPVAALNVSTRYCRFKKM
jgi:hypothetical protein